VADGREQAEPDRGQDLVEIGRQDLGQGSMGGPGGDAIGVIRRVPVHVDAADHVVVDVAGEMVADLGRVPAVPGDLDPEADRHALLGPALGGLADDALPLAEGGEVEG
jgi:hypothetical protein